MVRRFLFFLFFLIAVVIAVAYGYLRPAPIPSPAVEHSQLTEKTVLYHGLPHPLQFYLRQTVSRTPYVTRTAVLWGTGEKAYRWGPFTLWMPVSWVAAIDINRGFVWEGDVTWWGIPLTRLSDRFDLQNADNQPGHDAYLPNQGMDARVAAVWLPSCLIDREIGLQWIAPGRSGTYVHFPHYADSDSLLVLFNPRTHALVGVHGETNSHDVNGTWRVRFSAWNWLGGLTVPGEGETTVVGVPHYRFSVAGISYNIDTDEYFENGVGHLLRSQQIRADSVRVLQDTVQVSVDSSLTR